MELVILILILFIVINTILKLSFWKWWQTGIFALICAGFVVWMYPYAIQQSKTQIADYLQNVNAMQNAAVLVTIESAVCFGFCFAALRNMFGKTVKRWVKAFYWYPGLLIFPVLFYVLTQSIFALPGTSFSTIAYGLAAIIIVALPLLSYGIRLLIPEKEFRLEIHFLVSLFVCILGLITTVNGNVTYKAMEEPLNLKAITLSAGLFLLMFIIGFIWNKFIKWRVENGERRMGLRMKK